MQKFALIMIISVGVGCSGEPHDATSGQNSETSEERDCPGSSRSSELSDDVCRQKTSRESCFDAGCTKWEEVQFGIIAENEGECRVVDDEQVKRCIVEPCSDRGTIVNASAQEYTRVLDNGDRKVMKVSSGIGEVKGWTKCHEFMPDEDQCGCDF
jgi:hypothetical protein